MVALLGKTSEESPLCDQALHSIWQTLCANPRVRVCFQHYQGTQFTGAAADAPYGVAQTLLWEMELIPRLSRKHAIKNSEAHQVVAPVVTGFTVLGSLIRTDVRAFCRKFCTENASAAPAWKGLSGVTAQDFDRGCERIRRRLPKILPTHNQYRTAREMEEIRRLDAAMIENATTLRLFPQHILFVIAYYGICSENLRGRVYAQDSMYEVGATMRRNPDRMVMFVPDHCMLCPTCGAHDPASRGLSCGVLPDDLRPAENPMCNRVNMTLMHTLGLEFFEPISSAELVERVFDRVAPDHLSFTYEGSPPQAWAYVRGREAGMGFLDAYRDPDAVSNRIRSLLAHEDIQGCLAKDDRRHMTEVLLRAERASDARERYLALIDESFTYLWKFYLERAVGQYARLPGAVRHERREKAAEQIPDSHHVSPWAGALTHEEVKRRPRPVLAAEVLPVERDNLTAVAEGWRSGVYSSGFLTIGNRPAIAETAVKAARGKDTLYLTILCADRKPAAVNAETRIGSNLIAGQRIIHLTKLDDCLAVLLSSPGEPELCRHFAVSARGVKAAKIVTLENYNQTGETWINETEWTVDTGVEDGLWRATLAITGRCLPRDFRVGGTCRLNVVRFVRNERLFSHSWAEIHRNWWDMDMFLYQIDRFGWLI